MPRSMKWPQAILLTASLCTAGAGATEHEQELLLDNGTLQVRATAGLGGRVLGLNLVGEPNLLKVGEAVRSQPDPRVAADADDIAYLGHDVWVGPQSQWWRHQQANPARRAAGANWPPDPYLAFARTTLERPAPQVLEFTGVASPVSGVRLHKRVALSPQRRDSVDLSVRAENVRRKPVAWDLWFNSRVSAATRVFVPLAQAADLRVQRPDQAGLQVPAHRIADGLFVLAPAELDAAQRGKFLLQPAAGWIAGFRGRQLLVIRFAHQPRARIHPEQGQVELYVDAVAGAAEDGLMELEVHAPYRQLAPGQAMQAGEHWTVLRYDGPADAASQRRFLCRQAPALSLHGACGDG
jgi:hypothetical protein